MKKHHKRRSHKMGAISKSSVMDGAALAGGAVAGVYASQMLVPMIAPAGTNPWIVNGGRVAAGLLLAAMAPGGTYGELLKGLGAGVAADGGAKILNYLVKGGTMVAGPVQPTTAIGAYGTVAGRRMAGPALPTSAIGMVKTSAAPQGAAISIN